MNAEGGALLALIGRLEEATEGDRDLDADIALALGHDVTEVQTRYTMELASVVRYKHGPLTGMREPVLRYTTSIDAALTLVPSHMLVENLGEMRDAGARTGWWLAQLSPRGPRRRMVGSITAENLRATLDADPLVSAPTAPLALCVAALKARQSVLSPEQHASHRETASPSEPKGER